MALEAMKTITDDFTGVVEATPSIGIGGLNKDSDLENVTLEVTHSGFDAFGLLCDHFHSSCHKKGVQTIGHNIVHDVGHN